jgi:hypothetical protein
MVDDNPQQAKKQFKLLLMQHVGTKELVKNYQHFKSNDKETNQELIANHDYFLMFDRNKDPESLYIIANSNTRHESLDKLMDTFAQQGITNTEHDIDTFKNYNFGNFVTRIDLDKNNLVFIKSLFDEKNENEKPYYKFFSKAE